MYSRGPYKTRPMADRFWEKVDKSAGPDGCWRWTVSTNHGYGQFYLHGKPARAHRLAYELLVGPIPGGLTLDHLCHTRDETCRGGDDCPHRRCVNPAHLEAVSDLTNRQRGRSPGAEHARVTHCPQNHEYTPENTRITTRGGRVCRTCHREERNKSYHAQRRAIRDSGRN